MSDNSGSWIPIDPTQHEPSACKAVVVAASFMLTALMSTGSAGQPDPYALQLELGTGSMLLQISSTLAASPAHPLDEQLRIVRSTLHLSISELAELFGVSRPTIYSWQRGGSINDKHARQIRNLVAAIEPHLQLLHAHPGRLTHRAVDGRKTVLQLLHDGRTPHDVVSKLVNLLEAEASQRQRMTQRLRGRTPRHAADTDTLG